MAQAGGGIAWRELMAGGEGLAGREEAWEPGKQDLLGSMRCSPWGHPPEGHLSLTRPVPLAHLPPKDPAPQHPTLRPCSQRRPRG